MRNRDRSSMKLLSILAALLVLGITGSAGSAHAFDLTGAGGRLGFSTPEDFDGTAEVGVHAEFEHPGTAFHLQPNLMYWSVDHVRDLSPNFDVLYHFNRETRVTPYVGAGLGFHFVNDSRADRGSTDLGMNLIGGLRFPNTSNRYFVEGRYTASDISQFAVLGGITFPTR